MNTARVFINGVELPGVRSVEFKVPLQDKSDAVEKFKPALPTIPEVRIQWQSAPPESIETMLIDSLEKQLKEAREEIARPDLSSLFAALTDEQRAELTADYCKHCWRRHPKDGFCQCWNDE